MFYKFVGGDDETILGVLDRVVEGSLKLSAALHFNDPFEFKFTSVPPTREAFDAWHRENDPGRSATELEDAWASFSGPASHWNTTYSPRLDLLCGIFVLCLTRRWDSHLMWAHYASAHRGFAVTYSDGLLDAVSEDEGFVGCVDVTYQDEPPELRWFQCSRSEMLEPVLSTKSTEWAYERELRVCLAGDRAPALYRTVDPSVVTGIILGPRAPEALRARALAAQAANPSLEVKQVSAGKRYEMTLVNVEANVRRATHVL